ncbi:hypothetical protein [Chlamydiifrater phoenicopteri]|uniref:hypothetical protein n=1 Tax=Chlamydiifrater phoenicopteri TaxID=2681469 RepID=UPI001BCD7D22|nr:hypothetical protein [Chlamydiifrater phoenicopteri]
MDLKDCCSNVSLSPNELNLHNVKTEVERKVVIASRVCDILLTAVVVSALVLLSSLMLLGIVNVIPLGGFLGLFFLDALPLAVSSVAVAFLLVSGSCFYFVKRKKENLLLEEKALAVRDMEAAKSVEVCTKEISLAEATTQTGGEDLEERQVDSKIALEDVAGSLSDEEVSVEVLDDVKALMSSQEKLDSALAEKASLIKEPLENPPVPGAEGGEITTALTGFLLSLQPESSI